MPGKVRLYGESMFYEKLPNCFKVAVPFCIPTSNEWKFLLLQNLSSFSTDIYGALNNVPWIPALSNSMKWGAMPVGPRKTNGSWWRVLKKHGPLEREWQTTSIFLPWEPREQHEKANRTLKNELPRSVGAQYTPNSRKNEQMEPKWKQHPYVDVTGNGSKAQCCKEQYCIGTWNVRSMNQGKLEVVKQETARVNTNRSASLNSWPGIPLQFGAKKN